jgi:hypothetical protein
MPEAVSRMTLAQIFHYCQMNEDRPGRLTAEDIKRRRKAQ